MDKLDALEIGSKVLPIISNYEFTHIHSIFNRVINLWVDKRILSISTRDVDVSPNAIVSSLNKENGWKSFNVTKDSKVTIVDRHISIDNCFLLDISSTKVYKGIIDSESIAINKHTAQANLELLRNITSDTSYHSLPLNELCSDLPIIVDNTNHYSAKQPYTSFILDPLLGLIKCIKKGDIKGLNSYANKLIGFGHGLTPTGDDILSGIMLALSLTSKALNYEDYILNHVNPAIIKGCEDLTNTLSFEFLYYCSSGYGSSSIEELIKHILSSSDKDIIHLYLNKVLSIGHSSGFDITFGIQVGLYLGLQLGDILKR